MQITEPEERVRGLGVYGRKVVVEHDWDAVVGLCFEEV